MLAELTAIRDRIRDLSTEAHPVNVGIGDMTGIAAPLVSVWGPPGNRPGDAPVSGTGGSTQARVGITCATARADATLKLAGDVIGLLTPDRMSSWLTADGRSVELSFVEARAVQTDRAVTLPGSNTHPTYCVVLFDAHSHPST